MQQAIEREGLKVPIRVAVMGCVVNGPGEAREADLGIAAGKGQGFLIVRGEVVAKRRPGRRSRLVHAPSVSTFGVVQACT